MLTELDEQEFLPPEALQTIELDLTFDKFSGDIAETFGGEMRAVVRATAVGDYNANQLAYLRSAGRGARGKTHVAQWASFQRRRH